MTFSSSFESKQNAKLKFIIKADMAKFQYVCSQFNKISSGLYCSYSLTQEFYSQLRMYPKKIIQKE